jgi:S1-C subfamily serine protease
MGGFMSSNSLQAFSEDLAALAELAGQFVVRIEARNRVAGSGIVWSADGALLTADHVLEREENIQAIVSGATLEAELVGRDPATDLAALRVKGTQLKAAEWSDSKAAKIGQLVVAIGRPWGDQPIVSLGCISTFSPVGFGGVGSGQFAEGLIQSDVVLYPGFSGGPLVDAYGRIVGVNSSVIGRGMSLAIPAETAVRVMSDLLSKGRVQRGYLGIGVQKIPLGESLRQKLGLTQQTGLLILTIEPGSGAEKAGLMQGDILVGADEKNLARVRELHAWLSGQKVGQEVRARVIRGGTLESISVSISSR